MKIHGNAGEKKFGCQGICANSPETTHQIFEVHAVRRRAWRIISSENPIPTTRLGGTNFASRRDSQPAPQPSPGRCPWRKPQFLQHWQGDGQVSSSIPRAVQTPPRRLNSSQRYRFLLSTI